MIGGTVFLGRYLVESALARDHTVTLFNRGQHGNDLFPQVERLRGDRVNDLGLLRGRRWDAVIDTCGYVPSAVGSSARRLADAVDHYTFISTMSVYKELLENMDETAPVATISDEQLREAEKIVPQERATALTYGKQYGALKALCERAAEKAMPGRVLTVRSALIVGPHDYSDRFTFWVRRVARGGEVLAPGRPERSIEFTDVRDLSDWIIRMVERGGTGIYNTRGPDYPLTMGRLLEECKTVTRSDARFTWVSEEFLLEAGVKPWSEMPLWIPQADRNFDTVNGEKARADGLTYRPLSETIRDTLAWEVTRPADVKWIAGLDAEREKQLLHDWHERQSFNQTEDTTRDG